MACISPRLPPELVDHIIDHSRDDKDTLRMLSLVSKSWLPRTHHHLFRIIRATTKTSQRKDRYLSPFSSFVTMLKAGPSPSVTASVQFLMLSSGTIFLLELAEVLRHLHRLRTLYLKNMEIFIAPPASLQGDIPSLPIYENLKLLWMLNCTLVQDISHIFTVIAFSRSIQALRLSGLKLADETRTDFTCTESHDVLVDSLEVYDNFSEADDTVGLSDTLADGILSLLDSRSLSSLVVNVGRDVNEACKKFLSAAAPRLEELTVSVYRKKLFGKPQN